MCYDVQTQAVEKTCSNSTLESCDVVSKQQPKEVCDLVPAETITHKVCDYKPRPVEREVCQVKPLFYG